MLLVIYPMKPSMKRWFILAGIILMLIDACVSVGVKKPKPKPKPTKISVRYYQVAGDSILRHDSCLSELNRLAVKSI